jgi:hypothetical protein
MPRYKPHTRDSIERIRETIDTQAAIKELHAIGHDKENPVGVRVKALSVLLEKTMPSLTQADIIHHRDEHTPVEMLERLKKILPADAYQVLSVGYDPEVH